MKKVIVIAIVVIALGMGVYFVFGRRYNYYDDSGMLDDVSYNIPNGFEVRDYGDSRYYNYYGEYVSCRFEIVGFDTYLYKDGKRYLEEYVNVRLKDEVGDIEKVSLQEVEWYFLKVNKDNGVYYYYATVRDDKGYYFEYNISDYLNGDYEKGNNRFCEVAYEKIISSIKIN